MTEGKWECSSWPLRGDLEHRAQLGRGGMLHGNRLVWEAGAARLAEA